MSRHPLTGKVLAALQKRSKGAGFRHKGQCDLCHGYTPGQPSQSFPVGKGVHSVAGFKICDTHAKRLEAIAASSGIVWPGYGLAREYGLSVMRMADR